MKKIKIILICVFAFFLMAAANTNGQTCGNAITYTSSYPWVAGHGTISTTYGTKNNDWTRLNWLLTNCTGKIIFNEAEYFINQTLPVHGARILEGSGSNAVISFPSSKIVQTANLPIFKIGTNIYDVAIRDLALIGYLPLRNQEGTDINTNTIGILAEGGTTGNCITNPPPPQTPDTGNCSSIGFQFSNLSFTNLNKGIYANAVNNEWQFDNIRLDHARFYGCIIGVHINSFNSGWNISSLDFLIPAGIEQGESQSIAGKTYGIYLQRSTYTSIDLLIGNGPSSTGPALATSLIYVKEHGNLSIQSSVAEGFHDDVVVHGNSRTHLINLMNNSFLNGVRISTATVNSFANQFFANSVAAVASNNAQIYSIGDKFCFEGETGCDEGRGYETQTGGRVIYSSNQGKNTTVVPTFMDNLLSVKRDSYSFADLPILSVTAPTYSAPPLFRLGVRSFNYDFWRDETDGKLVVRGNQNGFSGYSFEMCENCTGNPPTGTINRVTINNNGSVTFGSVTYSALGSPNDGTMVYCSNCQETNPCSSGGSGAMAKKIAGSWKCN